MSKGQGNAGGSRALGFRETVRRDFRANRLVYLIAVPVLAYYVLFHYLPMYGAIIAFKDFSPGQGILGSPWVGLANFKSFFQSFYFLRVTRNTLLISVYSLIFGFPAPIILALLFNEVRRESFKKVAQTLSYLPHFISTIVVCGMIVDFTARDGVITQLVVLLTRGASTNLLTRPELFRPIYIASEVWQQTGWGAIIYLAALAGINAELYEAAVIDGAGRWRQTWHITLPGILPIVVIMLILRIGGMMEVGYDKIILLYSPPTYETGDVISTFVYRKGLLNSDYSFSTAVGLFNSVLSFILLITANQLSRRVNETSLW